MDLLNEVLRDALVALAVFLLAAGVPKLGAAGRRGLSHIGAWARVLGRAGWSPVRLSWHWGKSLRRVRKTEDRVGQLEGRASPWPHSSVAVAAIEEAMTSNLEPFQRICLLAALRGNTDPRVLNTALSRSGIQFSIEDILRQMESKDKNRFTCKTKHGTKIAVVIPWAPLQFVVSIGNAPIQRFDDEHDAIEAIRRIVDHEGGLE